jgi:hypothetical protein
MATSKQQYLEQIRSSTAYPTYRGFIGIIALLGYALAGLSALSALIGGIGAMSASFISGLGILLMGLIGAALAFLGARFFKEAALILVDIGDSIVETNARTTPGS